MIDQTITLKDQSTHEGITQVQLKANPQGVSVEFTNEDGQVIASTLVELHEGRLRVHAWNELDEDHDPTITLTLVDDVRDARKRRFDDQGNVIKP
jgi:hypothetical protein